MSGVTLVSGEGVSGVSGVISGVVSGVTGFVEGSFVPGRVTAGVFVPLGVSILLSVQEERQNAENANTATRVNIVFFILISFDI